MFRRWPNYLRVSMGECLLTSWSRADQSAMPQLPAAVAAACRGRHHGGAVGVRVRHDPQCRAAFLSRCPGARQAARWHGGAWRQKPALRHASALQVTTFGCAAGALACLPFAGQLASQLASAPWRASLSVAYLGVFPTAVAFTTWAYALARTSAGAMGATVYAVPALTVLMSWGILGQVPRRTALAGGVLCLAGVVISRRRTPERRSPGSPPRDGGRPRRGLRRPGRAARRPAGLAPGRPRPAARRRLPAPPAGRSAP